MDSILTLRSIGLTKVTKISLKPCEGFCTVYFMPLVMDIKLYFKEIRMCVGF